MTSPAPTQPLPTQTPVLTPENKVTTMTEYESAQKKPVRATPVRRRIGETRSAHIIKAILRPPFKFLYYLSSWTKTHKLASLGILLLLGISIGTTYYYATPTHELPFGINHDPFDFPYDGGKGEGVIVKDWLYALKNGDTTHLALLEQNLPQGQTTDPAQLVSQYSEAKAHLTWGDVDVISVHQQPDSTIDSFVQIPLSTKGPGTSVKAILLIHFVTASVNGQGPALLGVDPMPLRPLAS
jgi:hypothetical protein